jgi:uncharacterized membrane protein
VILRDSVDPYPRPAYESLVNLRQLIAVIALVNGLVAVYLHLWKLGYTGSLSCGAGGGCAYVQGSRYGWFMGVDVALIGAVGYTLVFIVALMGSLAAFEARRWPTTLLHLLVWPAIAFTIRLKYAEFIVLRSFCAWCAISAVSITILAVLVTLDQRRVQRLAV